MKKILFGFITLYILGIYGCSGSASTSSSGLSPSKISIPYKYHDDIPNRVPQSISYQYGDNNNYTAFYDTIKIVKKLDSAPVVAPWDSIITSSGSRLKYPSVLEKIQPVYPDLANRAHVEGKVIVKAWLKGEGISKKIVVMQSSAEIFTNPVIEAVNHWKFASLPENSDIPGVWAYLEFDFIIQNDSPKVLMPY